jgi:hypothetical protein
MAPSTSALAIRDAHDNVKRSIGTRHEREALDELRRVVAAAQEAQRAGR